jgi:hypothetical protein
VYTFLGLLGVAVFIVCIISLAAGITWLVVKISPPANGDTAKNPSRST